MLVPLQDLYGVAVKLDLQGEMRTCARPTLTCRGDLDFDYAELSLPLNPLELGEVLSHVCILDSRLFVTCHRKTSNKILVTYKRGSSSAWIGAQARLEEAHQQAASFCMQQGLESALELAVRWPSSLQSVHDASQP